LIETTIIGLLTYVLVLVPGYGGGIDRDDRYKAFEITKRAVEMVEEETEKSNNKHCPKDNI
jgi:hypothetical protein